jgi:hypothetical protein
MSQLTYKILHYVVFSWVQDACNFIILLHVTKYSKRQSFLLYRPWTPLVLREIEAPTFSDVRLIDGGKFVSPTRLPLCTPRKIPGIHFC